MAIPITDIAAQNLQDLNLQDGQNYLNSLANKFIVRPKTAKGIAGFVFDYDGDSTVTLSSEITDHYLESNDPIQDHIAQKPVRITLRGFVSELAQKAPEGIVGALSTIQNKLTAVPAYIGRYTPGAVQGIQKGINAAQATVNEINLGLSKVQNIVSFLPTLLPSSSPRQTKQQAAFAQLASLWESRQIFTVETPFRYFDAMAIESLSFLQPEDTRDWCDITVTMKQLRFVETRTISSSSVFSGRSAIQRQGKANQGKTQGTPIESSVLFDAINGNGFRFPFFGGSN
jgi:hypothetical protein